jgi:hypothetical protein
MPREKSAVGDHMVKQILNSYVCSCEANRYATEEDYMVCPFHTGTVPKCQFCQKDSSYSVVLHSGKNVTLCDDCCRKRTAKGKQNSSGYV